jgi:hypothetical protein
LQGYYRRGWGRTEVVVPTEPATVTGVDVHGNVGQVERLESISDTITVAGGRVFAGLEVGVGDQVGEGVGLDDQSNGGVGVLLEDGNNGCTRSVWLIRLSVKSALTVNVLGLVYIQATDGKLSVGCLGGAITAGKIVDDQSSNLVTRDILDAVLDDGNLVTGVASNLVRLHTVRIKSRLTHIHMKVPISATLAAAVASAGSLIAEAAETTSEE